MRGKKLRKTEEDEPRGDSDESASFALSPHAVNRHLFMRINETNLRAALRLSFFGIGTACGSTSMRRSRFTDREFTAAGPRACLSFSRERSA